MEIDAFAVRILHQPPKACSYCTTSQFPIWAGPLWESEWHGYANWVFSRVGREQLGVSSD